VYDMYHVLEPEVAGGLGPRTVMGASTHPPVVSKLHYQLDGWLGDELLESFPCFVVTENMRTLIETCEPTGCSFDVVELSVSEQFMELYGNRIIPNFWWLKINGKAGHDDFGISNQNELVVSERVVRIMREAQLDNCDIDEYQN